MTVRPLLCEEGRARPTPVLPPHNNNSPLLISNTPIVVDYNILRMLNIRVCGVLHIRGKGLILLKPLPPKLCIMHPSTGFLSVSDTLEYPHYVLPGAAPGCLSGKSLQSGSLLLEGFRNPWGPQTPNSIPKTLWPANRRTEHPSNLNAHNLHKAIV